MPFRHTNYVSFAGTDPQALRKSFAEKLPAEFEVLNSAIFRYRQMHFSALGVTRVDTDKLILMSAGFNHLGVLLFDLTLDNDKIESRYIFPEFTKRGDFAAVMLKDVKSVYFDRVPDASSEVRREKDKIIFCKKTEGKRLEYVFSGEGYFLAEKNYYEESRLVWGVSYYEYLSENGKIYPRNILLRNRKYGYDLIIKLKEIRSS